MFSDECAALPTTINLPICFFQVYFASLFASYNFVPVFRCVGNCRIIYSDLSQSYCLERPKSRECKIAIFYFQSKGKGKMSVNCEPLDCSRRDSARSIHMQQMSRSDQDLEQICSSSFIYIWNDKFGSTNFWIDLSDVHLRG